MNTAVHVPGSFESCSTIAHNVSQRATQKHEREQQHSQQFAQSVSSTSRIPMSISRIPITPRASVGIQEKLMVGPPGDRFEQEADQVAERVLSMPAPTLAAGQAPPRIQRACASCEAEKKKEEAGEHSGKIGDEQHPDVKESALQTDSSGRRATPTTGRSGGRPLPTSEQTFFEQRFGHSFDNVRVHTDTASAEEARRLNARAFTHGRDIVFAPGEFSPGTTAGKRLLAHELTHVVQQGNGETEMIQRDLATPEPAVAPAAQPELTEAEIDAAIAFNKNRYNDSSTKLIQDLVGTKPTGTWVKDDIIAIASIQEEFGLNKDGRVGADTFRFLDKEVRLEKLNKTDKNCLVSFNINTNPVSVGAVAGGSRTIKAKFTMRAQFPKHCNCPDYEYRQFIKGHWKRERGGVTTDLGNTFSNFPGGAGLPSVWTEDGNTKATALNYGHRTQTAEAINHYLDDTGAEDQANGCQYKGEDEPGGPDTVVAGDVFDIELNFRGEIQRKGSVVRTKFWTPIKGRFPVP